jgi:hypothetical protein
MPNGKQLKFWVSALSLFVGAILSVYSHAYNIGLREEADRCDVNYSDFIKRSDKELAALDEHILFDLHIFHPSASWGPLTGRLLPMQVCAVTGWCLIIFGIGIPFTNSSKKRGAHP